MPQARFVNEKSSGLLKYLFLLTVFFIFVEVSFMLHFSGIYLGDYRALARHFDFSWKIVPGILFFLFAQFSIHFIYTISVWALALGVGRACNCTQQRTESLGFIFWVCGVVALLLANQCYFPNSKFSVLTSILIPHSLAYFLLSVFTLIFFIFFILAASRFLSKIFWGLAILFIAFKGFDFYHHSHIQDGATEEKPNIILIGIDSLRPDFLSFFGYSQVSPHFDAFLNQSAVFTEALTPLARTFPAWVSILTGLYPKNNSIRTNLENTNQLNTDNLLTTRLHDLGYETIYASDETRFSNIDHFFGFDKVVTPPIGFNDFLLGTMNDFPLSNLLVNTFIGKWLFPYSYANRPLFVTYNPNTFLKLIEPTLEKSRTKPLFLAIHFCLPHFPYFWGNVIANDKSIHNYQASVKRVDQQFADFLKLLDKGKLLQHSIVVLLSDHGEAIELPGDRATEADLFVRNNKKVPIPHFYPPSFEFESVNQTAGHGTDVLGIPQYHVVFAFRFYGTPVNSKMISGRASLLDIKPTLLQLLKQPTGKTDGFSLAKVIQDNNSRLTNNKDFFIETDLTPEAIRSSHPEMRKALMEGMDYFQLKPGTTRLLVRKNMLDLIISCKQYADFYREWVLALYPQPDNSLMPVLVNLKTGKWTNDLNSSFANKAPVQHMIDAIIGFYPELSDKDFTS